jgi:pimeloyl-ACP methyl ester carboxylesterase
MAMTPLLRLGTLMWALFLALWSLAGAAGTLAALPAPLESFEAGSLHVDRYGDGGRTLIFIPGLGSGPWSWAEQITRFRSSYRVYVLTLSGFDGRPFVAQPDLFGTFSRDFWSLLDTRHIAHPVVIGHSLGGTLAIALAEQHPERLAGVIALDGLPVFPTVAQQTADQRIAAAAAFAARIASQTPEQLLAAEVTYMQAIGTIDPALVQPTAALEARSDARAMAAWTQADLSADLRPALPNAKVPLLELMPYAPNGPYTEDQTLEFYRALLAGAPNVTVEPIDGAKHFAMLDQPALVDAAITRFLAAVAVGPSTPPRR